MATELMRASCRTAHNLFDWHSLLLDAQRLATGTSDTRERLRSHFNTHEGVYGWLQTASQMENWCSLILLLFFLLHGLWLCGFSSTFFSLLSHPSVESLYLTTPLAVGFLIHQVFHRLARNKCLCFFTVRSVSLLSPLKRVVYHKMVPMTRTKMHHDNVIRSFLYTLTLRYR